MNRCCCCKTGGNGGQNIGGNKNTTGPNGEKYFMCGPNNECTKSYKPGCKCVCEEQDVYGAHIVNGKVRHICSSKRRNGLNDDCPWCRDPPPEVPPPEEAFNCCTGGNMCFMPQPQAYTAMPTFCYPGNCFNNINGRC